MSELVLDVERLIWRGRALAREEAGRVVLLQPGVFPGERVRARVTASKKDHVRAEWVEILEPAPQRRSHPCPLSDRCGGCRFGHIPQREQLEQKRELFLSEMRRSLGRKWAWQAPERTAVYPSPAGWRYRWRGQVEVANGAPHLKALGSRELVRCPDCLLFSRPLARGMLRLSPELAPGRRTLAASPEDGFVRADGDTERLVLPLPEYGLQLLPRADSFFQANWRLNRELVRFVEGRTAGLARVADLYAGAGNFALPCATSAGSVLALEGEQGAAEGAALAARNFGLDNLRVSGLDLASRESAGMIGDFAPQALVLDPPRSGGGKRLRVLRDLPGLQRLIWVSCDVVNTCRDLIPFLEAGWRIRETALFDMFPQTWHMESVFVLEPENAGSTPD
jgi:23S rRNA (uracil1939-C5)-methyltransferase